MRLSARLALLFSVFSLVIVLPAHAALAFSDVPRSYWDMGQIKYVAITHTWMRDYGRDVFKPSALETRSFLARTLVTVYAPTEPIDPSIHFSDLPDNDPFYRYANVAVKLGWMTKFGYNRWAGTAPVRTFVFDKAIILAMGKFSAPLAGLASIHQADGTPYKVSETFPHQQLARWLGLHYDHSDDTMDLQSRTKMKRDEVAYSLWAAMTLPSWQIDSAAKFDDVKLPVATSMQQKVTSYALNQVGFPYIWSGEWNAVSPPGYCCGYQPQGGFDCSGFAWWVLKKNEDGYNAAQFRNYAGWSLPQRSSYEIAEFTKTKLTWRQLKPGNVMMFADNGGNRWQDVTHVGIYLGNGWMMHSTDGGPQLQWVGDGYYRDHFVWGRAL
jgi:hypothetical protein